MFYMSIVYSCCISGLLKTLFIRHGERVKFEQIKFEISPFWLWIQKAKPFENKLNSTVYIGKRSADEQPNANGRLKDIDHDSDSDGSGNSLLQIFTCRTVSDHDDYRGKRQHPQKCSVTQALILCPIVSNLLVF